MVDMNKLQAVLIDRLDRANIRPPVPEHSAVLPFDGSLAGADPISEAADYLEDLARRLPTP